MRRIAPWRAALALLAGPAGLAAQGAGGLTVLVLDERSRPLEGAQGQVSEVVGSSGPEGLIHFPGLPPGRWQLTVRYIGYRPDTRDVLIRPGRQPTRVIVKLEPAPLQLPPVIVEATRPGVYGVVSTTRLEPLRGAVVELLGRRGRTVRTDSAGRFAHPEASGAYLLLVRAEGYRERRFSVDVPEGGGQELLVHLDPAGSGDAATGNLERYYLRDLRSRLAWANRRNVLTRAQLAQHGLRSVCEVPEVAAMMNRAMRPPRGMVTILDGHRVVPNLCAIRALEVEIVEWGSDVCGNSTGALADLFRATCDPRTDASGRLGQGRTRIFNRGPAYVVVWLAR